MPIKTQTDPRFRRNMRPRSGIKSRRLFDSEAKKTKFDKDLNSAFLAQVRDLLRLTSDTGASLSQLRVIDVGQKVQYKHQPSRHIKSKGGKPPIDFTAVELRVDLEIAYKAGDMPNMRLNYYKLRRLIS